MVERPAFEPRAILVADMVGYSRWLAHQPVATHVAFTNHVRHVFEPAVRAHGGQVVKTTGDGIVAVFRHPSEAERSARDIQSRLEGPAVEIGPEVNLRYRLAVHYGKVLLLPDDVVGIDVNAAMHMHTLAPPGGICISGRLFALLDEDSKARYTYAGRRYLKNIPDPLSVYLYSTEPGISRERLRAGQLPVLRRNTLSPLPRLGVGEIRTYAERESQHVIATFAQDALMEGLSRFRDLFVVCPIRAQIDRGSGQIGGLREFMARDLALEYLIHGSCLIESERVTLIIHCEYLVRRELIWSTKIATEAKNFDGLGGKITSECVIPIVMHLQRHEAESWNVLRESEDERLFREARALMGQSTLEATDRARRILAGIVERSGEIGNVYLALARAEHNYGLLLAGGQFVEALEQARIYARKAIELDDLNPRAHGELALQDLFLKRHASAVEGYQRALRLNPYDPILLADWADCLALTGSAEEALPILENLSVSWPSDRAWVDWNRCDAEWALNRPEKIIDLLRDKPDLPQVRRYLTASYAKLGRMTEARQHAERVRAHQPNFSAKAWSEVPPYADRDVAEGYADFLASAGL